MEDDLSMRGPEGPETQLTPSERQLLEQLNRVRAEQEAERRDNQAQIQSLQSKVSSLQSAQATPATPNANTSHDEVPPRRKKPSLPDPPKFGGLRSGFRAWYLEMKNKLTVDGPSIGTHADQFAYIYSRLEKTPQNMTIVYVEQGGKAGTRNPDDYMEYLNVCYGDPNVQSRAIDRLRRLRQKETESFAVFHPRFEKELADSGGATWSDVVQINYLEGALNNRMRDRLVSCLDVPKEYPGYVKTLQILGSRIDSLEYGRKQNQPRAQRRSPSPRQREQKSQGATTDEMDWEPTKISRMIQNANKELEGKRAKWVDQAEIDRRREEQRCLRCGRTGCWSSKCPLEPARRPGSLRGTAVTEVKRVEPVTKAAVADDDDDEFDLISKDQSEGRSGKE